MLLLSRRDESVKSFAGKERGGDRPLPHFGSGRHGKNNRCWPPKRQKRARRAKNHSKILAAPQKLQSLPFQFRRRRRRVFAANQKGKENTKKMRIKKLHKLMLEKRALEVSFWSVGALLCDHPE